MVALFSFCLFAIGKLPTGQIRLNSPSVENSKLLLENSKLLPFENALVTRHMQ